MCCLPCKTVMSFTNFQATAIVGMWAVLPRGCTTESNKMFRNLSVMALLAKNVTFQFANANISFSQQLKLNLSRIIRPFTFYAISFALDTMMITCSSFSQKDDRHFIFLLLKPPSLKIPILFSADKIEFVYYPKYSANFC